MTLALSQVRRVILLDTDIVVLRGIAPLWQVLLTLTLTLTLTPTLTLTRTLTAVAALSSVWRRGVGIGQ